MRDTTVSRSYAEALFTLAGKQNQHEEFAAGMEAVRELLAGSPQIGVFLTSPQIKAEAKKQALQKALGGKVPALLLNFLFVVIDKRRQRMLQEIALEYRSLLDEKMGRLHVDVTLAHEPSAAQTQEIATDLSRVLGTQVIPHVRVDAGIIGGIIVRYRDRVLDGSLRRRLLGMRSRLLDATLAKTT